MQQYIQLMRHVKDTGIVKSDRTGTGTRSIFGHQMRFNLQEGFPLLTTKKIHLKSIIHELIWFLAGDTNIKYLQDNGVRIWDEWADANGDLGPVYGYQWRSWPGAIKMQGTNAVSNQWEPMSSKELTSEINYLDGYLKQESIDQISEVISQLKNNPDSRRMIVSAWNPADIPNMKLPPCHALFQFYTRELTLSQREAYSKHKSEHRGTEAWGRAIQGNAEDVKAAHECFDAEGIPRRYLDCQLYQRSADVLLGVPFNIASYAMLTHMIAQQTNMLPGEFVWTGGDCHLYSNHMEQVDLQLSRDIRATPQLVINRRPDSIFDYKFEDFEIVGYDPHPGIKAQVAV